jgi:hypothetical protein
MHCSCLLQLESLGLVFLLLVAHVGMFVLVYLVLEEQEKKVRAGHRHGGGVRGAIKRHCLDCVTKLTCHRLT